ncbi:MAG: hypothetical protein C5B57_13800 [Blastocatellia bacterium]|nr:MAG: hypothetical protein C5B57_13800 [Blastocatellia bacterium]
MMRDRLLIKDIVLLAMMTLTPLLAAAQSRTSTPSRTSDGKPDLSGIYSFSTITPLQRPDALAGKATLDEHEAEAFEESENTRLNRDLFDPIKGQPSAGYAPRAEGGVLSYNEFWYERGNRLTKDKRTSLIVDPPDGKIPLTEAARRRNTERTLVSNSGFGNSYEDRPLADRCLIGFNAGPPMTPGAYNNNVQIVQAPGTVVIVNEMVHNARIIPTDGRPHTKLRQWSGDSRGHWEGDTLVVETTNFRRETSLQGSTADTRLVERFTRMNADTIRYEFTVSDPNSYIRPWTAVVPLSKIPGPLFEYACHEGNYALPNILAGARAKEKQQAEAPQ